MDLLNRRIVLLYNRGLVMKLDLLEIGKIVRTHGVKGAVKVMSYIDKEFNTFKHIYIGEKKQSAHIVRVQSLNNDAYSVTIDVIPDIDTAEKYKNQSIYIDRSEYDDLIEQLYLSDLIGKSVLDENGEILGTLVDYNNYGASDILEIRCGAVSYSLPFVDDIIYFDEDKEAFVIEKQRFIDMRV